MSRRERDNALLESLSQKPQSNRYLNEAIRTRCFVDMLQMKLFPNAKEVTESFAAYNGVRMHLHHLKFNDPSVVCLVVGDGVRPRTGATFAMRSAWEVHSIDPIMRELDYPIRRLTLHRRKVEDCRIDTGDRPVVIVGVHSHAHVRDSVKAVNGTGQVSALEIPCCVPQSLPYPCLAKEYVDNGILSPKNKVYVWPIARYVI